MAVITRYSFNAGVNSLAQRALTHTDAYTGSTENGRKKESTAHTHSEEKQRMKEKKKKERINKEWKNEKAKKR